MCAWVPACLLPLHMLKVLTISVMYNYYTATILV
jgi:hypothetical protein